MELPIVMTGFRFFRKSTSSFLSSQDPVEAGIAQNLTSRVSDDLVALSPEYMTGRRQRVLCMPSNILPTMRYREYLRGVTEVT